MIVYCLLWGGLSVVSPRGGGRGAPRQTSTRQSASPSWTSTTRPQEFFANLIVWCALHREYTLHEDLQWSGVRVMRKLPCLHMPLHVHPLLPVGSTRTVWTKGSPIHSNESVEAAGGGTVEPLIECTKGTKGAYGEAPRGIEPLVCHRRAVARGPEGLDS